MDDTKRLEWVMECILMGKHDDDAITRLRAKCALELLNITDKDLEGPGDVTLGEMFRAAIDRNEFLFRQ